MGPTHSRSAHAIRALQLRRPGRGAALLPVAFDFERSETDRRIKSPLALGCGRLLASAHDGKDDLTTDSRSLND
jgi:hypothetical protein